MKLMRMLNEKKVAVIKHCNLFFFISLLVIYNGIYSTNASIAS